MEPAVVYRNALAAQSMLHEYRLESVLGAGSFGVTYLGWDAHLEKHVAIKEYLPTELAMRAADGTVVPLASATEPAYREGLERYIIEARTLAKFSHPNIVRVVRYFEANGTGYMVMDYEKGEPLGDLLKRAPRPDEALLRHMLMPLLDGLRAVHAAGFLHRDIKPGNIFMRGTGGPVLIDFGAARQALGGATKTLTAVLTPGYAPLEQYLNEGRQGPWTDLYALGAVLYRAVTDASPPDALARLQGDTVAETLERARPRYGEPFVKAIAWAMLPDEKRRPQSVDQWQGALLGAAAVPAAASAPATVAPTVRITPREAPGARRPMPPATPKKSGARWPRVLALALIALGVLGYWKRHRAAAERAAQQPVPAVVTHPAAPSPPPVQRAAAPAPQAEPAGAPQQPASAVPAAQEAAPAPPRPAPRPDRLRGLEPEARAQFDSADRNGDGYLSRRELRESFPFLARHFERIDANGDGRISFNEFRRARLAQFARRRPR